MPKRPKALLNLRRATIEVTKWMEKNTELDMMDQLYLENSIEMLRMAYATWTTRKAKRTERELNLGHDDGPKAPKPIS